MRFRSQQGFTLIEIILALALTAVVSLAALSLTSVVDRAHRGVSDRIEAEHSGQATLDYLVREMQTATAFYYSQALQSSIGYRKTAVDAAGTETHTYWRLSVSADSRLRRRQFEDPAFNTPAGPEEVISDGINNLALRYSPDGVEATAVTPATVGDPKEFYVIFVDFSVTCGTSTAALASAVSTLNIKGTDVTDALGNITGEVI